MENYYKKMVYTISGLNKEVEYFDGYGLMIFGYERIKKLVDKLKNKEYEFKDDEGELI